MSSKPTEMIILKEILKNHQFVLIDFSVSKRWASVVDSLVSEENEGCEIHRNFWRLLTRDPLMVSK